MGRGIAQMAAQAGATVWLLDTQPGAAEAARTALEGTWTALVGKQRMTAEAAADCTARLRVAAAMADLSACDLVVEAIVEKLDVKQALFAQLETLLPEQAVLATNTSSLSVTAIGAKLQRPQRLVGYHFFNPVPLMKVVEVVPGLKTDPAVVEKLCELTRQFGHTPVVAQDTPGFIVNHAGRGYNTEALRVLGEGISDTGMTLGDMLGSRLKGGN